MGSPITLAESWSSSPNIKWSYDVFLSFRGEDTRSNFTSHLNMALRQKGVNFFIDDKLDKGGQNSESLFKSIEGSRISIIIFSENYASSTWCLDELVKIVECMKSKGQIVLPVFYKVNPFDVRKQTGSFGEALAKHQFMTKIQTWKEALTTAAGLAGWDLATRKDEADLVRDLTHEVLSKLNHTPLYVAKYPVGIDSQLENLMLQSCVVSDDVKMVGIHGMGGIGKTTLAKALYNKIANQYEGCCFLSNVRKASQRFDGLVQLQEKLLYEILKDDLKVGNLDRGINIIRDRLHLMKVLILLDDVNEREQLEALVGGRDWFGRGSKIIVTTRNKHLLLSLEFDETYGIIGGLNYVKALELFSWHAFMESHPPKNYLDLSERAVGYCKGLPLALVILGSFLRGRDPAKWKSILDEFENSLDKGILDVLQISFDGLEDRVKDIFLDISCLLVGENVNCVKNILKACNRNPDFGITVLMDLSLITIENDKVEMHDLIRQMGQLIVRGESFEPGKRSRLWVEEDVVDVLTENSGTDAVTAIKLDLPKARELDIDAQAFRNMKNLRLLIFRNARFSTNLEYLPNTLRWIEWSGFAFPSLSPCFIGKKLIGLDLQHSHIRNLGKIFKNCERLKHVNLSHSIFLEEILDLSAASNLERLCLRNCKNLSTICESVVSLGNLITLDLERCSNLKKLPSYLPLKFLNDLNLACCKKLEEIPDLSATPNLKRLCLKKCTNLRRINESIGSLDKLVTLDLEQCSNLKKLSSYFRLRSLEVLNLSGCCKLEQFPEIDENMKSLRLMLLEFTAIKELPSSIGYLTRLEVLSLDGCTNLIALPNEIHSLKNLEELSVRGCSRLDTFHHKWEPASQPASSSSKMIKEIITPSSSVFSCSLIPNLPKMTLLDLQCCISNVDFLKTFYDVSTFLNDLLLKEKKFSSLPSCLHKYMSVRNLQLRSCKFLPQISNPPQYVQKMDAIVCKLLARIPDSVVDMIFRKQDFNLGDFGREFITWKGETSEWLNYHSTTNLKSISFLNCPNMERIVGGCIIFKVGGDSYPVEVVALISCDVFIGNRLQSSCIVKFPPSKSEYMWSATRFEISMSTEVLEKILKIIHIDENCLN